MFDIFGFSLPQVIGVVGDARAMSPEEIQEYQMRNTQNANQATMPSWLLTGAQNYNPYPESHVIQRDDRLGYCYAAGA